MHASTTEMSLCLVLPSDSLREGGIIKIIMKKTSFPIPAFESFKRKCIFLVSRFHVERQTSKYQLSRRDSRVLDCTHRRAARKEESQLQLIKISTEFVENRFARYDSKISRGESRWRTTTRERGNWEECTIVQRFPIIG